MGQPRIGEEVRAPGRLRIEATYLLVVAAGAGFEARETVPHAVFDAGVVADDEVQMLHVLTGAPVATVECVALLHVEGAGDRHPVAQRHHEAEPLAKALAHHFEEALVQVEPPPRIGVDRRAIEAHRFGGVIYCGDPLVLEEHETALGTTGTPHADPENRNAF